MNYLLLLLSNDLLCSYTDAIIVHIYNGTPPKIIYEWCRCVNRYGQWCSGGGATGAIAPVPIFQDGAPLQFLFHLFLVNFAYILQKLAFDLNYYWPT